MGKNKDLAQILTLVILGMFLPLLGSVMVVFKLNILEIDDLIKIGLVSIVFLILFALELLAVFLYFLVTSETASKKNR